MTVTAGVNGSARAVGIPGERAVSRAQLVPTADWVGTVHSVFATTCNLAVGELLITVHDAARSHTPTSIRVRTSGPRPWSPTVQRGERVEQRDGWLQFGRHSLDLSRVSVWLPASIRLRAGSPARQHQLAHQLSFLEDFRRRSSPPMDPMLDRDARALTTALRALSGRVRSGTFHHPQPEIDALVKRLLGSGPGLTPAGDDVLVGLLAVLSSAEDLVAEHHSGQPMGPAAAGLRTAVSRHLLRTNDISANYLGLAVAGHFGESVGELLRALASGWSDRLLLDRAAAVISIGASSGADTLRGVAAGLAVVLTDVPHDQTQENVA